MTVRRKIFRGEIPLAPKGQKDREDEIIGGINIGASGGPLEEETLQIDLASLDLMRESKGKKKPGNCLYVCMCMCVCVCVCAWNKGKAW
jgi:hypothetical protein